ncbi:MAG: DUF3616 domain-containing protein, partial [Chitinophagaceae bacterium]|nr:DUF3616 domain-containing protein [Rubrivivax sp.]
VYCWPGARSVLAANREPVRFEADALQEWQGLPHGRGTNRAEALCELPPELSGGKPAWLVLYDAPGPDRKVAEHAVTADLLRRGQGPGPGSAELEPTVGQDELGG